MQLSDPERRYLAEEVAAYLDQLRAPDARRTYGELQTAIDEGGVPDQLQEPLGRLLELSLSTGRLRRIHGPHAEMSAMRLFARCPQGRVLADTVSRVNQALEGLAGQQIEHLTFSLRGPASYGLTFETDCCRMHLVIERDGIRVHALESSL